MRINDPGWLPDQTTYLRFQSSEYMSGNKVGNFQKMNELLKILLEWRNW